MAKKFRVEIECDNAAFEDAGWRWQVADILSGVSVEVADGTATEGRISDVNGNRVGIWKYTAPRARGRREE